MRRVVWVLLVTMAACSRKPATPAPAVATPPPSATTLPTGFPVQPGDLAALGWRADSVIRALSAESGQWRGEIRASGEGLLAGLQMIPYRSGDASKRALDLQADMRRSVQEAASVSYDGVTLVVTWAETSTHRRGFEVARRQGSWHVIAHVYAEPGAAIADAELRRRVDALVAHLAARAR